MVISDLEPLFPEDLDELPVRRERRTIPLRTVAAVAGVTLVVGLAFAARGLLERAELDRLGRTWASAQLVEDQLGPLQVRQLRVSEGTTAYSAALIQASYAEQASRLARVGGQMHGWLLVDAGLASVRRAMVKALALETADLQRSADYWRQYPAGTEPLFLSSSSTAARVHAEQLLEAARHRLHRGQPKPAATAPLLAARHAPPVVDSPIPSRLLLAEPGGLTVVDLATGDVAPIPIQLNPALQVRQVVDLGPVAVLRTTDFGGAVEFWGARLSTGGVVDLGPGAGFADLVGSGGLVIGRRPDGAVVAFDQQLRTARGPFALPAADRVAGLTQAGLVVTSALGRVEVRSFAQPSAVQRLIGVGTAVGVCGDQILWDGGYEPPSAVRITDATSGVTRVVDPGIGILAVDTPVSCSPDGTHAAAAWLGRRGDDAGPPAVAPGIIDLSDATVGLASSGFDGEPDAAGITWTPAGDRVFLAGNPGPNSGPDLVTFRPGDAGVTHLRLAGTILAFAPVPFSPG